VIKQDTLDRLVPLAPCATIVAHRDPRSCKTFPGNGSPTIKSGNSYYRGGSITEAARNAVFKADSEEV